MERKRSIVVVRVAKVGPAEVASDETRQVGPARVARVREGHVHRRSEDAGARGGWIPVASQRGRTARRRGRGEDVRGRTSTTIDLVSVLFKQPLTRPVVEAASKSRHPSTSLVGPKG